jgi:ParB family transcriptional regulator, chromosome partitioning protein
MTARRGLGRGLETLLRDARATPGDAALREVPLDQIERGAYQPRRNFPAADLEALADSIRAQGVVQPIVVRARADGRFELIAGERRWRAAQMAGLARIPAVVRELDDQAALAVALIENIQRQDLNPLEEAAALRRLTQEFGLTHEAVARAVGRSRTAVTNLLRLLDLAPGARALVDEGRLEMGHARALLTLDALSQERLARRIAAEGLSVRQVERLVAANGRPPRTAPRRPDPNLRALEEDLAQRLGAPVALEHGRRGGRVVIRYHSLEQLDEILARLR